ncbi:MAG: response regulator [Solirubrobacterales bacterium]|nr:response regulator [Solirubrobacterales bacterium]
MGALPGEEIKTVLVVEDDPSISDPLVRFLERNGLHTITSRSVKETRAILERIVPDCVILDIGLSDDSQGGFIVAAELKSHGAPPVMFYSASGSDSDIELGLKLGADDFQVKGEVSLNASISAGCAGSSVMIQQIRTSSIRSGASGSGSQLLRNWTRAEPSNTTPSSACLHPRAGSRGA